MPEPLHIGSPEKVFGKLCDHLVKERKKDPMRPLFVLLPSNNESAVLSRWALKAKLGGVIPLTPIDYASRSFLANGMILSKPSPAEERKALRQALRKIQPLHPELSRCAESGKTGALAILHNAVSRLVEWLPIVDPGHPIEESPILALTLAWEEVWRKETTYIPQSLWMGRARLLPRQAPAPDAVWGLADLNRTEEDLFSPWRNETPWFVPSPAHDEIGARHLDRLVSFLQCEIVDEGAETAPANWHIFGHISESVSVAYRECDEGGGVLATPPSLIEPVGLLSTMLLRGQAPPLVRPLGSTPAGLWARLLSGGEGMGDIDRREVMEAMKARGWGGEDWEKATRRLGIQRWGEDLNRLSQALGGEIPPPRGLGDSKKWVKKLKEVTEKVRWGDIDRTLLTGPDPRGREAIRVAWGDEGSKSSLTECLILEKAPKEEGKGGRLPLPLRAAALNPHGPLHLIGMTADRFPGSLDAQMLQDHALETHLELPDERDRLHELSWQAWCLSTTRNGKPTEVYTDSLDDRGEARFATPLLELSEGKEGHGHTLLPVGPRYKAQIALSKWEGSGVKDDRFKVEPSNEGIGLRVTSIREGAPPCPFAHWASLGGGPVEDPSGRLEPTSRELGSVFHLALEEGWRLHAMGVSLTESDFSALIQGAVQWFPMGLQEAGRSATDRLVVGALKVFHAWTEGPLSEFEEGEAEWSPTKEGLPKGSFKLPGLESVWLRGKIDWVGKGPTSWLMVDYKTGTGPRETGKPSDLTQAALYPFAGSPTSHQIRFAYFYPLETREDHRKFVLANPNPLAGQGWETLRDKLNLWKGDWDGGSRAPKPSDKGCKWCDWAEACRKDNWELWTQ